MAIKRYAINEQGEVVENPTGAYCRVNEISSMLNFAAECEGYHARIRKYGDTNLGELTEAYVVEQERLRTAHARVEPSSATEQFLKVPNGNLNKSFYIEAIEDRLRLRSAGASDICFWIKYHNVTEAYEPGGTIHIDSLYRITHYTPPSKDAANAN